MIPKLIHMCWLSGDPYPPKIQFCIDSWKKYLPDYEVMLWDTNRFDINSVPWTKQAFEAKKYAFVADYIRLYAVYNYGGIYLDTDVEVIRSFDNLLGLPYFVCRETGPDGIETAAFGAEKGTSWVKAMLDYYQGRNFILKNGEIDLRPMPMVMYYHVFKDFDWKLIDDPGQFDTDPSKICVFSRDWFCGRHMNPVNGSTYNVTENTHCIHHFANSWTDQEYLGGPLHKLYYKITGKNWKYSDKRFQLYGADKKKL